MNQPIGPFVEGEVPEPLSYQFLTAAGEPIDLDGYSASFSLRIGSGDTEDHPATVTDAENGEVTYTWQAGDLVPGVIRAEFVVSNNTNAYVSERLVGLVRQALTQPQ